MDSLGLKFLHNHGIVHLDLGKENVMIIENPDKKDSFCAKIIDFGHANLSDTLFSPQKHQQQEQHTLIYLYV